MKNLPLVRGEYRYDYQLAPLTWFKVGGPAEVLYKPTDIEDLVTFFMSVPEEIPICTFGAGSNLIIRDGGIDGVVVKLGRNFTDVTVVEPGLLKVGAGTLNYNLAQFCWQNSIAGFEFLVGIPGTIGGGIASNAGAYGREFKDILVSANFVSRSGFKEIKLADLGLSYRHNQSLKPEMICVEVLLHYELGDMHEIKRKMEAISTERQQTQPVKLKTSGSTFANPKGLKAWQLIDEAGMRGAIVGGAQMSPLHCNFMINNGEANAADLENLGEKVREAVFAKTGIELRWEVKIVGKRGG